MVGTDLRTKKASGNRLKTANHGRRSSIGLSRGLVLEATASPQTRLTMVRVVRRKGGRYGPEDNGERSVKKCSAGEAGLLDLSIAGLREGYFALRYASTSA